MAKNAGSAVARVSCLAESIPNEKRRGFQFYDTVTGTPIPMLPVTGTGP